MVDRYVAAIGGQAAVDSIQTLVLITENTRPDKNETSRSFYYIQRPNLSRSDVLREGQPGRILITDGKTTVLGTIDPDSGQSGPFTIVPGATPLAAAASNDLLILQHVGLFTAYKKQDISLEYLGNGLVNGKETDRIASTQPDGRRQELDFDIESGLLLQTTEKDLLGRTHTSLRSDYRNAGGVFWSFTQKNIGPLRDVPEGTTIVRIVDIKINEPIDPALFTIDK